MPVDFDGDSVDIKYTGISVHRLYDCLAVLLQNAHKHGVEDVPILVSVCAERASEDSVLDRLSIDITSTVDVENYKTSKLRIAKAIESKETGADMVTEGYTGIKKIKFITRTSEGVHTMRHTSNDEVRELKLGFSIHAETATEDSTVAAPS
ncbi:hypothetical protein D3C86_1714750 [compost metagenome]